MSHLYIARRPLPYFSNWITFLLIYTLTSACSSLPTNSTQVHSEKHPGVPAPDLNLTIKGLGPCNNTTNSELRLNSDHPVTVLVHGCYGSAGSFQLLSEVLAFHGQQSACFSYNDRDSMMVSSRQLSGAIEELSTYLKNPRITVIGHSQGGLVARKAFISERSDSIDTHAELHLVTVSSPLSGINAARYCANSFLRIITLGLHDAACWLVSGDKWYEITSASEFIKYPGALHSSVRQYLLVSTDETDSCRRYDNTGKCLEDDFVFTLEEQALPEVPSGAIAREVVIKAGHVEIVGENGVIPRKLIRTLQKEGYIDPTELRQKAEFNTLLTRLYKSED